MLTMCSTLFHAVGNVQEAENTVNVCKKFTILLGERRLPNIEQLKTIKLESKDIVKNKKKHTLVQSSGKNWQFDTIKMLKTVRTVLQNANKVDTWAVGPRAANVMLWN